MIKCKKNVENYEKLKIQKINQIILKIAILI
jgi:hypothetical protein